MESAFVALNTQSDVQCLFVNLPFEEACANHRHIVHLRGDLDRRYSFGSELIVLLLGLHRLLHTTSLLRCDV